MLEALPYYLAIGALAGMTSGLLGLGGGVVTVPILYVLFANQQMSPDYLMHVAVGTSLAAIIFTAISSVRAHHRRGAVMWTVVKNMLPGLAFGAVAGTLLAQHLDTRSLRIIFGMFEVMIAIQMGFSLMPFANHRMPGRFGLGNVGVFIGSVSTLIGIGGGTLTVPFLRWCRVDMRHAVATSAACGLPIAMVGTVSFILLGWRHTGDLPWSLGYVYLPAWLGIVVVSMAVAPLGARLAHRLPVNTLKRVFALFLGGVGIKMLIG